MVDGRLIEIAHLNGTDPGIWRLWCVDRNGDECAVRVSCPRDGALPELSEEIWWQSGKVYFDGDKSSLPKLGNSWDPRNTD